MKMLHIDSSALGTHSVTRELTAAVVARWQDSVPGLQVQYRDLDANPVPHLTGRSLAKADPAEVADAEQVLTQFLAADVVVIWANTQLDHKVSQPFTTAAPAKTFTCARRGVAALAEEVSRHVQSSAKGRRARR